MADVHRPAGVKGQNGAVVVVAESVDPVTVW
jgi:hypothetical protein